MITKNVGSHSSGTSALGSDGQSHRSALWDGTRQLNGPENAPIPPLLNVLEEAEAFAYSFWKQTLGNKRTELCQTGLKDCETHDNFAGASWFSTILTLTCRSAFSPIPTAKRSPRHNVDDGDSLNKNEKLVSKLVKRPDTFLVSEAGIHQIPQLLVTFYPEVRNMCPLCLYNADLHFSRQVPHPVSRTEVLKAQQRGQRDLLDHQVPAGKDSLLGVAVGDVNVADKHVLASGLHRINLLVSLLELATIQVCTPSFDRQFQ
ncbi:hypothetical protein BKA70DRAFT_1234082 [Coprinopsis sp. MPI-PUGE-AT-0042]|nr:hypothetical protein BKA70DRAFT_1234082 [Coprinopsis sp. MPI-PUGE-AT-0042]